MSTFAELDAVYQHAEELIAHTCDDANDMQESRIVNTLIIMCRDESVIQPITRGRFSATCDGKSQATII